jgi:hypothetical protein
VAAGQGAESAIPGDSDYTSGQLVEEGNVGRRSSGCESATDTPLVLSSYLWHRLGGGDS